VSKTQLHKIISYLIAAIWLINGLFCKVLNLVPRHEQIVSRILGDDHSRILTILIGLSEIGMSVWIVIGFKKRLNSLLQIIIVAIMNILEFILVPDLLLWGKFNSVFAFILILVIYYNEFFLNPKSLKK
jgi:uncharacterized membrane protein YphA (DoxX/SURF4 family)